MGGARIVPTFVLERLLDPRGLMASARPSSLRAILLSSLLVVAGLFALGPGRAFAGDAIANPPAPHETRATQAPGARALERRLFAPCCYTQTLDLHESESAHELRSEIQRRLDAGERADAIEQSLVTRYGPRIRAVPSKDPMELIAPAMLVLVGLSGILVLRLIRRWQRRFERTGGLVPAPAAGPDAYDERLDTELRNLD